MANQMIALQARAPQAPDLGGLAARYGNMMAQQRTSERQAAVAQQQMDLARTAEARKVASEGRDEARFNLEQLDGGAKFFRDNVGKIQPGDVAGAQALIDIVAGIAPNFKTILPRADVLANDDGVRKKAAMDAKEIVAYTTTQLRQQVVADANGNQSVVTFGGNQQDQPFSAPVMKLEPDPNAPAASAAPTAAASPEQLGAAAQYLLGNSKANVSDPALRGLSPEDLTRAQGLADQMRSGGTMQPISMNTGGQMAGGQGQPDMGAIVQDMFATGVISQSNMNALKQFAGPEKAAQMAQIMQANNFRVMPDEQAAPAGMRNAVFRPEQDAAQMQLAQNVPQGMRISNRQLQGADPTMGRYPGTALVDPNIIGAQERAKERAAADVKMQTAPKIAAATKSAENIEALRVEQPKAKVTAQANLRALAQSIRNMDEYLRDKTRNQLFGVVDSRTIPFFQTQTQADVQAKFNQIKQAEVIRSLIAQRQSTPTGGAPLGGNTSDFDAARVEQASSAMTQGGSMENNDREVQKIRQVAYDMFKQEQELYEATYGPVIKGNPNARLNVPAVAPAYRRSSSSQRPAAAPAGSVDRNNPLLKGM